MKHNKMISENNLKMPLRCSPVAPTNDSAITYGDSASVESSNEAGSDIVNAVSEKVPEDVLSTGLSISLFEAHITNTIIMIIASIRRYALCVNIISI